MNIAEQIRLKLKLKENHEIEYKSAAGGFPKAEFWKSFSAFANTNGGTIVIGVKEKNHKFITDGLTDEQIEKYRKEFWDDAHNKSCVNQPLLFESDLEEMETDGGQKVLTFHIPRVAYDLRPIHLTLTPFGHTYKRRHEGDYLCTDDEVKQMYSDANNMKSSADSRILRGYSMDDIDMPTLHQYRRAYNRTHENHPWVDVDDMKFLENIGAYRKDRANLTEGFTVAGILMFGRTNSITDPECCQEFFPDYRERMSEDPMDEYLEGGHSVCRNPVLQKMFIFLGIGEKGGSGADIIAKGWKDNGWAAPTLVEKSAPDRVETTMFVSQQAMIDDVADNIVDKLSIKREIVDKYKINDDFIDNMADLMTYIKDNPHSSTETLSTIVDKSISRTKNYLQALVELQCITAEGGNRNRTYSVKL